MIKYIKGLLFSGLFGVVLVGVGFASADFPYGTIENNDGGDASIEMRDHLKQSTVDNEDGLLVKFLEMYELNEYDGDDKATHYVKGIINLVLSLASFIVFCWMLYGFYMMFFSDHEEGMERSRKIMKMTIIALALIAVSWMIVTFFFYIFGAITAA